VPPHERQLCCRSLAFPFQTTVATKQAPQLPAEHQLPRWCFLDILPAAVVLVCSVICTVVMPVLYFMRELYTQGAALILKAIAEGLDLGIVSHMLSA
jgi:hypothetical protein